MTHFIVYEKVIRKPSAFVANILKDPRYQSNERVISLPGFQAKTFNLYHQWLLTGKLYSKNALTAPEFRFFREISLLAWAIILGHYLLDTNFLDTLSDAMIQCVSQQQHGVFRFFSG